MVYYSLILCVIPVDKEGAISVRLPVRVPVVAIVGVPIPPVAVVLIPMEVAIPVRYPALLGSDEPGN